MWPWRFDPAGLNCSGHVTLAPESPGSPLLIPPCRRTERSAGGLVARVGPLNSPPWQRFNPPQSHQCAPETAGNSRSKRLTHTDTHRHIKTHTLPEWGSLLWFYQTHKIDYSQQLVRARPLTHDVNDVQSVWGLSTSARSQTGAIMERRRGIDLPAFPSQQEV